jgi:hypothetical protein
MSIDISDRDILATALLVIEQHGPSALYYAKGRIEELRDQGAFTGAAVWEKVAAAVEEIQRTRGPKEPIN